MKREETKWAASYDNLASYAAKANFGDEFDYSEYEYTSPYLMDVYKIMDSTLYNRLADKTQIFSFMKNDDLSRRSVHSQLVANVAMRIGRALNLNLDLIQAMSLGHDIGHTPFGHAGEMYLGNVYKAFNETYRGKTRYFNHNVQSVRVMKDVLELELCPEIYFGVLLHNSEIQQSVCFADNGQETKPIQEMKEHLDELVEECYHHEEMKKFIKGDNFRKLALPYLTLEGYVVRICDILAYTVKDVQDMEHSLMNNEVVDEDGKCKFPYGGHDYEPKDFLDIMIQDVVDHSNAEREERNGIPAGTIGMSEAGVEALRGAKSQDGNTNKARNARDGYKLDQMRDMLYVMYANFYDDIDNENDDSPIYWAYLDSFKNECVGSCYFEKDGDWKGPDTTLVKLDAISDFISSMTDDYFLSLCKLMKDKLIMKEELGKIDLPGINPNVYGKNVYREIDYIDYFDIHVYVGVSNKINQNEFAVGLVIDNGADVKPCRIENTGAGDPLSGYIIGIQKAYDYAEKKEISRIVCHIPDERVLKLIYGENTPGTEVTRDFVSWYNKIETKKDGVKLIINQLGNNTKAKKDEQDFAAEWAKYEEALEKFKTNKKKFENGELKERPEKPKRPNKKRTKLEYQKMARLLAQGEIK